MGIPAVLSTPYLSTHLAGLSEGAAMLQKQSLPYAGKRREAWGASAKAPSTSRSTRHLSEHRQNERWSIIERRNGIPVKDAHDDRFRALAAQLSFPVLSVAADARTIAFVCLNARLVPLEGHALSLKNGCSVDNKIAESLREFQTILIRCRPEILVVERRPHEDLGGAARACLQRVIQSARDSGIRVFRTSIREMSDWIVGEGKPTLHNATRALVLRYPELRRGFTRNGALRAQDYTVWRQQRSLALAFCLAHGFSASTIVGAFGKPPPTRPSV